MALLLDVSLRDLVTVSFEPNEMGTQMSNTSKPKSLPSELTDIIANGFSELEPYFSSKESSTTWVTGGRDSLKNRKKYEKAANESLFHDEPWLTLVALYGLFGNQKQLDSDKIVKSLNQLMSAVFNSRQGNPPPPVFKTVSGVNVEVYLRENSLFRDFYRNLLPRPNGYHPYRDIKESLKKKLGQPKGSLEGNTNLDALISGKSISGREIYIFIEAKFLSDISKDIKYLPVRNQIARNIDCAMDITTDGGQTLDGLKDFWFLLLTPGVFRTPAYGGPVQSPLDPFCPNRSRFYSYKMDDYLDPEKLRADLPHWHDKSLSPDQWKSVSKRIGWISFESIAREVVGAGLLSGPRLDAFRKFFSEREVWPFDIGVRTSTQS